jgi:hypothetical protein
LFGIDPIYLLIGAHAGFGELGGLFFLWALVEIINHSPRGLERARIASGWGVAFIFLSWIAGGYYYVWHYGNVVKPIILSGSVAWAHKIILESKEHIFIFIPVLALAGHRTIKGLEINEKTKLLTAAKWLIGIIVLLCFTMAAMGFFVSLAVRLSSGGTT